MELSFKNPLIREDMEMIKQELHRLGILDGFCHSTFLITGAAGMLASYLVYFLLYMNEYYHAEIEIFAQGRSKEKMMYKFNKFVNKPYFKILPDDICKPIETEEKIDFIIHAASLAGPQYYSTIPVEVAEPNALGTYYLLKLAKEKAVKGFLFFSSGDIYGKVTKADDIIETTVGMVNPLELHSCYGESKRMGETWCHLFAHEYGVPSKIARIAHTYGPTMDIENDPRVFASFVKNVIEGKDIILRSDGSAKRPFCYIADAVVAFFLILFKGEQGQACNVGNKDAFISVLELAKILVELSGNPKCMVRIASVKDSQIVENKDNIENNLNIDKLLELGWNPTFGVLDGFYRVLKCHDYIKNKA